MKNGVCILDDGSRVRFSLKRRARDPYYLVVFRGRDRVRKERSTKEANQRRAEQSAVTIIKRAFAPMVFVHNPSWDEAIREMEEHMEGKTLRQATIDDYRFAVNSLRSTFDESHGPAEVTAEMAEHYKIKRLRAGRAPATVEGDLRALNTVYGKWWIRTAKILKDNPFAGIDPPKIDRKPPRIILSEEVTTFFGWLQQRWNNWRLPILFLEVKSLIGCRITELASAKTDGLKDGRLRFEAETTKGRKQRSVKLPPEHFDELRKIAGQQFVFERFSEQLKRTHIKHGCLHHAHGVKSFAPHRLKRWLQKEKSTYIDENPEIKNFKLHNFRGTAMSRARTAGVTFDDAAVAFGCHPETMRKHYVALDEEAISDRVMDAIQRRNGEPTDPSGGNGSAKGRKRSKKRGED